MDIDKFVNREEIKNALEQRICPAHNEHPTVELTDTALSLEGCCEPFKEKLFEEMKSIMKEQALQSIMNQYRGLLGH